MKVVTKAAHLVVLMVLQLVGNLVVTTAAQMVVDLVGMTDGLKAGLKDELTVVVMAAYSGLKMAVLKASMSADA